MYRALVALDPANAEAFYNLGLALKQQDDFAAAEIELRHAAAARSGVARGAVHAGRRPMADRSRGRGLEQFREAIARKPDYADALLHARHRAETAGCAGRCDSRSSDEAIKYRPTSAEAHRSLGQALKQQGLEQAAAPELAEADRLDRKTADAQASTFAVSVGVQKLKAGDYPGAIERFREAVRLAADNPQAHYQLALALRHTGARAEAQRPFR